MLKSIRKENSQTLNSAKRLIAEFITNFSNLHEYCMELSHGVTLVRTIEALYSIITPNAEVSYLYLNNTSFLMLISSRFKKESFL